MRRTLAGLPGAQTGARTPGSVTGRLARPVAMGVPLSPTCSAHRGCCPPPGAAAGCAAPARRPPSAAARSPPSRRHTLVEGARGSQPSWRGTLVTFHSPSVYLQTQKSATEKRHHLFFPTFLRKYGTSARALQEYKAE